MDAAVKAARQGLAVIRVRPSPSSLFIEIKLYLFHCTVEGDSAVYGRAGDARSKPPSVISAPMRHWQCLTCCHGIDGEKSDRNDIVTDWRQCSVG
jgi:hypothetical protein